jgi:hypothetical protein
MSNHTPPAPPGWNKTVDDLFAELGALKRSSVGPPEIDWARDYQRSLIPVGTRFPKKGDVYEAVADIEVHYLISWAAPSTGGGMGTLMKGERIIVENGLLPRPISVYAKPKEYAAMEERMIPESDRKNKQYAGFYLSLKTVDLSRNFILVYEEATPVDYQL